MGLQLSPVIAGGGGVGSLTPITADLLYLRLDCTNDPLLLGATDDLILDASTTDKTSGNAFTVNVDAAGDDVIGINISLVSQGDYTNVAATRAAITSGGMLTPGDYNVGAVISLADHASDIGNTTIFGQLIHNTASNAGVSDIVGTMVIFATGLGGVDLDGTGGKTGERIILVDVGGGGSTKGMEIYVQNKTVAADSLTGLKVTVALDIAGPVFPVGIDVRNEGSEIAHAGFTLQGAWVQGINLGTGITNEAIVLESGTLVFDNYDSEIFNSRVVVGAGNHMTIHASDGLPAAGEPLDGGIVSIHGGAKANAGNDGYVRIGETGTPTQTLDVNSLYIKSILEVDGMGYFDAGLDINGGHLDVLGGYSLVFSGVCQLKLGTSQTPDAMTMALPATGNSLIIMDFDNRDTDYAHAQQLNPTIFLHSSNPAVDEWISFTHDKTDGVIDTGTGDVKFNSSILAGAYEFAEDAGFVTAMDMSVSATPAAGTQESYTFKIDGQSFMKMYAEADSAGSIQNEQIRVFKPFRTYDRVLEQQGADIASANDVTLGNDGNTFEITGAVQINRIVNTDWQNGVKVTLLFSGAPTVKHNQATGGANIIILLAGSADFVAAADSRLVLKLCEIGGVQAWREISRAVA